MEEIRGGRNKFKAQITVLAWFVGLLWGLEIVDTFVLGQTLNQYGVRPRSVNGLPGILLTPFLHGGMNHLIANTVPFIVLGWLVMLRRVSDFFVVTLVTVLVSGLGTWLVGSPGSVHIGASGLVFGYLGFLLLRGYFEHSFQSILIAVLVGFFYGGLIWGVLPSGPGVSWEAHLFGFIGGGLAARLLSSRRRRAVSEV